MSDNVQSGDTRKASEILLSIENKVQSLTQTMNSYNLNMRLILDRVNKIYNYIHQLEIQSASDVSNAQEKEIIDVKSENLITVAEGPSGPRRVGRSETYTAASPVAPTVQPAVIANTPKPQEATPASKSTNPDKKVPVSQRLTNDKGKDLFMAEVEIQDANKKTIQTTKTNATGKWQAHLKPGTYHVRTAKTDTATKEKIEAWQEITVPFSDSVVILPTAIIKKK